MTNSLSGHIPGPMSLHKFTFEEGHLADKTLGIPPRADGSTKTLSTSHTWDDPVGSTGASMPPRNGPCQKTRTGGDEETQKKLVMNKQDSTLCFVQSKLTRGRCRIPRLANGEATTEGFSAQAVHEHISSRLPSTRLFNLCNHSHSL
jgi:hypothetical protein